MDAATYMMSSAKKKSWVSTSTCKKGSWIPGLGSSHFSHCRCSHCAAVHANTVHWTSLRKPPLKSRTRIGQRVLVGADKLNGVVKYIGDLNSSHTNDPIYVGVKLDDPVGEHDGVFDGKRFFSCPEKHGLIIPANEVYQLKNKHNNTILNNGRHHHSLSSILVNKSWARNRIISSHSSLVTEYNKRNGVNDIIKETKFNSLTNSSKDQVFSITATPSPFEASLVDHPPPTVDAPLESEVKTGKKTNDVECEYSNVGDMRVEDAEDEIGEKFMFSKTHSRPKMLSLRNTSSTSGGVGVEEKSTKFTSSQFSGLSGNIMSFNQMKEDSNCGSGVNSSLTTDSDSVVVRVVKTLSKQPKGLDKQHIHNACCRSNPTSNQREICCVEDTHLVNISEPVSSPLLPPAPPGSEASITLSSCNSSNSQSSTETIEGKESLTSCLMSRLPPSPPPSNDEGAASLEEAEGTMDDVASFDRAMANWGGDVRAWFMAGTYQKLKDALQRGVKEIQWQRKIKEIERSGRYSIVARKLKVLCDTIQLDRQAVKEVKTETQIMKRTKKEKLAAVKIARANMEHRQKVKKEVHSKIGNYLVSNIKTGPQMIAVNNTHNTQ